MASAGKVTKVGDDAGDRDDFDNLFDDTPTGAPEEMSSGLSSSSKVVSDVTPHGGKSFVFAT